MSASHQYRPILPWISAGIAFAIVITGCGRGRHHTTATDPTVNFAIYQSASMVIGQPDFVSNTANQGSATPAANTLSYPYGGAFVSAGKLYAPDYSNNRLLVFNSIPSTNNASADFAIGQADLISRTAGPSATLLHGPQQSVVYSNKLLVAEYDSNRVSIYNSIPTTSPGTISVVIGQADKTSSATACTQSGLSVPETVTMAGNRVVVTDSGHNRVLIWNSIPTTDNQPADVVLGQADFVSCSVNRGGTAAANTLSYPAGVSSDGTRLAVADYNNNRVLIWNSIPTVNGQAADIVLGQVNFTNTAANHGGTASAFTLNHPYNGVHLTSNQLFVADSSNVRVLIWNSIPTANGQAADIVLGQPDFASTTQTASQTGFGSPTGVFLYNKQLIVTDTTNSRYLIFNGQ